MRLLRWRNTLTTSLPPLRNVSDKPIFVDGVTTFQGGINSSLAPLLLQKNQLSFSTNATVRGGFVSHRPPMRKLNLTFDSEDTKTAFETGLFQGAAWYRPEVGPEAIPCQIGGRLLYVVPGNTNSAQVTDVSIPGDPNPSSLLQAWLWQSEKWLIVNNGQDLPIFFDGTVSRRSLGQDRVDTGISTGFIAPAVGANVDIPLTGPWLGPIGGPVFVGDAVYNAIAAKTTSGTQLTGNTITLEKTFGPNTLIPALTNAYAPLELKTYLTAKFTMPQPLDFTNVIPKSGLSDFTIREDLLGAHNLGLLQANQIGIVKISQPWPYAIDSTHPVKRRLYIAGKLVYVNTVHDNGFTLHVFNCAEFDPSKTGPFPIGTIAQVDYQFNMPQSVASFITEAFASPAIGSTVVVNVESEYTGIIGQYLLIENQEYKVIAKGNTSTATLSYFLTAENVSDTPGFVHVTGVAVQISANELPPGRMGVYGMGRNWITLTDGRSFLAGDIVGGSSGTPGYDFKDAVLHITENTFLSGGGNFVVPGDAGDIRAMIFTATLDTSLGQGALQVFTVNTVFSCNAPVDRTIWQSLTNPILTQSLIGGGALGQWSTILANGDTIFRSLDGIRSLILARREFQTWGNTPISREVQRAIDADSVALGGFGSAMVFSNRLLMTSRPTVSPLGTFFKGAVALNFDPISTMGAKSASVWESLWTGINVLQWVKGRFAGVERAFAYTINTSTNKIELYELLNDGAAIADNNGADVPITWTIETACLFSQLKGKNEFDVVKLIDGEMRLAEVAGRVSVEVSYRSQFDPCWHDWTSFSICAVARVLGDPTQDNIQKQNRVDIGFGRPPVDDCDAINNRPNYIAESFQLRLKITGSCKIYGIQLKACAEPKPTFVAPICGDKECKLLDCIGEDDYDLYNFQDRFVPLSQDPKSNVAVYYNHACPPGESLAYNGATPLPAWITVDSANNRLVGAAATFSANTQDQADTNAQNALDAFGDDALADGDLVCEPPTPDIIFVPSETSGWGAAETAGGGFVVEAGTLYGLGATNAYSSLDGLAWTNLGAHQMGLDFWEPRGLTFGAGLFVCVTTSNSGGLAEKVYSSPDMITWTARNTIAVVGLQSVAFGAGLFIATATSSTNFASSADGITWAAQATTFNGNFRNVIFASGLFVAVGQVAGAQRIITSPDGITWTSRHSVGAGALVSVCHNGSVFITCGANGLILTSPDGITWTSQTFPVADDVESVGGGNGISTAVTDVGDAYTSVDDGVTWVFLRAESTASFPSKDQVYYPAANVIDIGFFV